MPPQPRRHNPQTQPITVTLKNFCRDYPAGGGVLRELLQNADDAGASAVKFVLDENSYPTESLLDASLAGFQGAALLAYNDATFSDTDFDSLSRIGDSRKIHDGSTTGKFGRGFNSVYNWTDSPSIVSGENLLILDPHHRWTKSFNNPGGPVYNFVEHSNDEAMKGQMAAFGRVMKEFDRPLQGTIIRIPLRTSNQAIDSEICDRETTFSDLATVMEGFASEFSRTGLLFMRNIEEITIIVGQDEPDEIKIQNRAVVKEHRKLINEAVQKAANNTLTPLDLSFQVDIESGKSNAKIVSTFTAHHRIEAYPDDDELRKWSIKEAVIPWLAVAAEFPVSSAEETRGWFFNVLPLPIPTNQPIHIHGRFSISPDRARLYGKDDISIQNPLPAQWNHWLYHEVLPTAWLHLLYELARQYPRQCMFDKWPVSLNNSNEPCYGVSQNVLKKIATNFDPLWYTSLGYVSSTSGLLAIGTELKTEKDAFHELEVPIIYLKNELRQLVEPIFDIDRLCPKALCSRLEMRPNKLRTISETAKQTLLHYLISDPGFSGYGGLEIFPFEDGTYKAIDTNVGFIHRNMEESHLFRLQPNQNIELQRLSSDTSEILRNGSSTLSLHPSLRGREIYDLNTYCLATFFHEFKATQDVIYLFDEDKAFVLQVWDWISSRNASLMDTNISPLWLIPLSNGQYRKIKPLDISCDTIYAPPGELGDFLRRLEALAEKHCRFILDSESLSQKSIAILVNALKSDSTLSIKHGGIIDHFISWLNKHRLFIKLTSQDEKLMLHKLLRDHSHLCQDISAASNVLKGLEIFQKVIWKSEGGRAIRTDEWTSLDTSKLVISLPEITQVPEGLGATILVAPSENTSNLLRFFGLAKCMTTQDFLQEHIIPFWSSHPIADWHPPCKSENAELILRHFYTLDEKSQEAAASLVMVPVARLDGKITGTYARAEQLIDPSHLSLNEIFFSNEEVRPAGWVFPKYKGILIQCGIKQKIDEELVDARVKVFAGMVTDVEKALKQVRHLLKSEVTWTAPPDNSQGSIVRQLKWLPAVDQFGSFKLMGASECRGKYDKLLVGFVLPVLDADVTEDWIQRLGWQSLLPHDTLLKQLEKAIERKDRIAIEAVLTYLMTKGQIGAVRANLAALPCVLTAGGDWVTYNKVFFSGGRKLTPYLHAVDSVFSERHQILLKALGTKSKPGPKDLLNVQEQLEANGMPLNASDTAVAIETIRIAAKFDRKYHSSLKILTTTNILCPIEDVTFQDRGNSTTMENYDFVHPEIKLQTIELLGIEYLSKRLKTAEFNPIDINDDDEFDQREEVETSISTTLDRYPIEVTFTEFLANAEDCGTATQLNWLLDERNHPDGNLVQPELGKFQGPALLVHNDGVFLERDFKGLAQVGKGSKTHDPSTIGKFGRGAHTMYHWTDVPVILSGKYLLILDPSQQVKLPKSKTGHRMVGIKIEISRLKRSGADQLAPFVGLWNFSPELDYYDGTIFRFALRVSDSQTPLRKINTPLDSHATRSRFQDYLSNARISLLFLKRIVSIDFTIQGRKTPVWSVSSKTVVADHGFSDCIISVLNQSADLGSSVAYHDRWLTYIQNPPLPSINLPDHQKRLMKNYECGLAALLPPTTNKDKDIQPSAPEPSFFSTLPLPFRSNLPIHVHATFLVTGDRQSIPTESSMKDAGADWNRWLLNSALPRLYLDFLECLGRKGGLDVFSFWPHELSVKDPLHELIYDGFWKLLPSSSKELFPRVRHDCGQELLEIANSTFDFLPRSQSNGLSDLLLMLFPGLTRVPPGLQGQLKLIDVAQVTPQRLRQTLHYEKSSQYLQKIGNEKSDVFEILLEFVLPTTADEFAELNGCRILPLVDGSLGVLRIGDQNNRLPHYYIANDNEKQIFHFAAEQLMSEKFGELFENLISIPADINIHRIGSRDVGKLLCNSSLASPSPLTKESEAWLPMFWDYWRRLEIRDELTDFDLNLKHYKIFEMRRGGDMKRHSSAAQIMAKTNPSVVDSDEKDHRELCSKFPGIYIINRSYMPASMRSKESSLNDWDSFYRFVQSISRLAEDDRMALEDYINHFLSLNDLQILRSVLLKHISKNLGLVISHLKVGQLRLKSLPLWQRVQSSMPYISSRLARMTTNSRLLIPWMNDYELFIDPACADSNLEALKLLDVRETTNQDLVTNFILPKLPKRMSAIERRDYLSLITFLSRMRDLEHFSDALRNAELAPDKRGVLQLPSKLFDHQDEIFEAAFRDETDDKFLSSEFEGTRSFWLSVGLVHSRDGMYLAQDYILCLRSISRRLQACQELSLNRQLLLDIDKVLLPLTLPGMGFENASRLEWSTVESIALFPARVTFNEQPRYRREAMETLAVAVNLIPLDKVIRSQHLPICWSQISFPKKEPKETTYDLLHHKGNPSMEMVWAHLKYMANTAEALVELDVANFISDLHATYSYLQANLKESTTYFKPRNSRVWLNLDISESNSVSLGDLKSSWFSIDYLMLASSCDSPPIMSVRSGLIPYERLLKALGCKSIIYATFNPPDICSHKTLSASIEGMRRAGKLLDVTIAAEGQEIRAHKVILAAASDYFETHFNGKWQDDQIIKLEEISLATLTVVVDFAYVDVFDWTYMQVGEHDSLDAIADKLDDLLDILTAADRFLMPHLKAQAEEQIRRADRKMIRIDNVLHIRDRAAQANAKNLYNACMEFYEKNKESVDLASQDIG